MGLTRTDLFTEQQNRLAAVAKALSHPARIAILQHLVKTKACINGDLVQELGLAQATISQHLRELKEAGLIQGTIDGVRINYCIDPKGWKVIRDSLGEFLDLYDEDSACC